MRRAVRDVSEANWLVLTCTNYDEWVVTMKVKLIARRLWKVIN